MNLPNKLTVTRLILVPVFFLAFMLGTHVAALKVVCTVIMLLSYIVAELSDLLDGKIARKYKLVTDLGKVMDPFADTLTHVTYFLCFVTYGIMPAWAFIIVMWREYGILFIRMLLAKYAGVSMPANIFGKSKTVLYAVDTILAIVYISLESFLPDPASVSWMAIYAKVLYVFFGLAAFAALMSFAIYMADVFKSKALSKMTR